MAIYPFLCPTPECGENIDIFCRWSELEAMAKPVCEKCKLEMTRQMTNATPVFKGPGWFKNDYPKRRN